MYETDAPRVAIGQVSDEAGAAGPCTMHPQPNHRYIIEWSLQTHFYRWCTVCLLYTIFSMAVLIVNHLDDDVHDHWSLSMSTENGPMSYIFTHILSIVAITHAWCTLTWTRLVGTTSAPFNLWGGAVALSTYVAYSGLACIPLSVDQPWHSYMFSAIMISHMCGYIPPVLTHSLGWLPPGVHIAPVELYAMSVGSMLSIAVTLAMITRTEWRSMSRLVLMWIEGAAMIAALWLNLGMTGYRIFDCIRHCAMTPATSHGNLSHTDKRMWPTL